ncbi:MAG: guanylate kinase [Candidatus Kapabacteria bacterium]|nr:guanylate kinase [Candidatus Kapabacteria bacterium]
MNKKLIVLSAPSGGGKTTVAKHLLSTFSNIKFSISATTRQKRENEINGRDYYFLTKEEFQEKINKNEFVEYEEIYGNYYGTLHSEINEAIKNNKILLFDVDVKGALSIKKAYPKEALLIFLMSPDFETLQKRLRERQTETEEQFNKRIERVKMELDMKDKFDFVVINDKLEQTLKEVENIVRNNIFQS